MREKKNRKFLPVGNSLLYISLLSVVLIASFTSIAILSSLFAICNSRLLPTNQIVNCDGRVRPIQGRTLFLCSLFQMPHLTPDLTADALIVLVPVQELLQPVLQ